MTTLVMGKECPCTKEGHISISHTPTCKKMFQSNIKPKYELIELVGYGAYGVVFSAINKETKEKVAIKRIAKAFENPLVALRTLREVKLLRSLSHDNVIGLKDIMIPLTMDEHTIMDVYLVYPLMEMDLLKVINSEHIKITDTHCKFFLLQMLLGLQHIQSANILHRDLKPDNILVDNNCNLKICDFGLSRVADDERKEKMTEYVVTRWYRAPELLLGSNQYGNEVDMWSIGCIFAEMLGGKPLFPGRNALDQIKCILRVIGTPKDSSDTEFIKNKRSLEFIEAQPYTPGIPLSALYPYTDLSAIDLLSKMLTLNPLKRITVNEALRHPWMNVTYSNYPCSKSTVVGNFCKQDLIVEDHIGEDINLMKTLMWEEMLHYVEKPTRMLPGFHGIRRKVTCIVSKGTSAINGEGTPNITVGGMGTQGSLSSTTTITGR